MAPTRRSVLAMPFLAAAPFGLRPGDTAAGTGVEVRTVASMTHVALPAPPLALAIARVTVPAGVETSAATAAGVRVILPEGGTVVARTGGGAATGAGPVGRWASGMPGDIPVASGAALAIAAADLAALRNPGVQPLTVVDAAIFPVPARPAPSSLTTEAGVHFRLLAYGELARLPAARADVAFSRVEAAPGAALPPWLMAGPMLLRVDSGVLAVAPTSDGVLAALSLGWPSFAGVGSADPLPRGRQADLPDGSALFLPAGAAARIVSAGDGPARLLVLRLAESEAG